MKKIVLFTQGILLCALLACQAPGAPSTDTKPDTSASSSPNPSASSSPDASSDSGTASGDANSSLKVEVDGKTYTRGQLKAFYECGASKESALKAASAQILTDIKAADAGNPAADAIYIRAANLAPNYKLTGCTI